MLLEEFDAKKYERSIREEGIALGRTLGMESGEYKKLIFIIGKMKSKGCTAEETANMLEEDLALVTKVYSALEAYDADTEWEKIVEFIKR